jgi:type IV pilus assembly protein PilW
VALSLYQRGVSLIELMVGMLVGLLAILLISQVLLTSEGQKRTTQGGSDAQVNGALSLYSIQRDVQMAGYGITSSPEVLGCPISARYSGAAPAAFPTTSPTPLAPVIITPAPLGAVGDSIRILASSKPGYSVPTRVRPPHYNVGELEFPVRTSLGFAQGDLALVATSATQPCWVFQVTAAPGATSLPRANNSTWNPASSPDIDYLDGSVLMNLGNLMDSTYELRSGNLWVTSFDSANPGTPVERQVQADIVDLRFFYGRDTSVTPDGTIDVYDTTTPTSNDGWRRVLAVRAILVARSGAYEKDMVTTANPEWSVGTLPAVAGAATCASSASACVTLEVGAGVAGDVPAKHHRYKVFDTVIPLRNMLWSAS